MDVDNIVVFLFQVTRQAIVLNAATVNCEVAFFQGTALIFHNRADTVF
ncbi:MAG: hypothetical protein K9L66_00285 [Spirochaetaceae bacterium]|nr:hypothetical protein [Spirochaetaceae bacterium]MCF7947183.1 hypothetical protein [Spirochaetia bacterium]MCF7950048.1 hypothetical protein [Spirochaetaceae bacterium]